jgi:hypothetical protein
MSIKSVTRLPHLIKVTLAVFAVGIYTISYGGGSRYSPKYEANIVLSNRVYDGVTNKSGRESHSCKAEFLKQFNNAMAARHEGNVPTVEQFQLQLATVTRSGNATRRQHLEYFVLAILGPNKALFA